MLGAMAPSPRTLVSLVVFAGLTAAAAACGGDDDGPACTVGYEKQAAFELMRQWYLYPELLPTVVDLDAYPSARAVVDAMTAEAREAGIDRGWSYVASLAAIEAQRAGAAVGFGFQLALRDDRLFVADVHAGSAADAASFRRGDEILAIGPTPDDLTAVAVLVAEGRLGEAFGPPEPGLARVFDVAPLAGEPMLRAMSKGQFEVDPVPTIAVVPRVDAAPVGYINLRTFGISAASEKLAAAFDALGEAGASDVVIDLRYNGGGALGLAIQLADHLGGGLAGEQMFTLRHNPQQRAEDLVALFNPVEPTLVRPRVAFIVSGGSASASELVPNVLDPYREVALVGSRTYGKPVGQYLFELEACPTIVALIAFRLDNAQGDGGYYDGLPDETFAGPLCDAPDDLTRAQGDPLEASTAAALTWLDTGGCPAAAPTAAARPRERFPLPAAPTPLQRELPGLY
jgi:carboxyl-terminal processing protease